MPLVPIETLPDDSRLWIFGARAPLDEVDAPRLMGAVDRFLNDWKAHNQPLTCAREFVDEHFLVVAVDERTEDASGCSIDGLFRLLQQAEEGIGTSMVGGGIVHFRGPVGMVHSCTRAEFTLMALEGDANEDTPVFDTTLTKLGDYRKRFEVPARESWHKELIAQARRA